VRLDHFHVLFDVVDVETNAEFFGDNDLFLIGQGVPAGREAGDVINCFLGEQDVESDDTLGDGHRGAEDDLNILQRVLNESLQESKLTDSSVGQEGLNGVVSVEQEVLEDGGLVDLRDLNMLRQVGAGGVSDVGVGQAEGDEAEVVNHFNYLL